MAPVEGLVGAGACLARPPKQVGISLFGPYLLGVELASMLLLAGLVAAHRLTHEDVRRIPPSDSSGVGAAGADAGAGPSSAPGGGY